MLGGMLPAFGEYLWWHDDKEGHARRKSVSTHLPLFFEGGHAGCMLTRRSESEQAIHLRTCDINSEIEGFDLSSL